MAVQRGSSHRVRYKDSKGGWHSETFHTKTAAKTRQAELRLERERGGVTDPRGGKVRFGVFATETFLPTKVDVDEATHGNIEARIRIHLAPFHEMPLRTIQPSDVLRWQAETKGTRAAETLNAALGTLRQVLALAVRDGLIPRNAAEGVNPLPTGCRKEIHPGTRDQIVGLSSAIVPRFSAAIILDGLGSGLRAGELWALQVPRLNLLKRELRVTESLDDRGSKLVTKEPKNDKHRTIRLDPATVEVLYEHLAAYPSDGYVFTSTEGGPVRHRNFVRRHFSPAVKACDLPAGFRFHDLRHTHASLLIADGWRDDQVKDRLGHGSIRTTIDTYGHLFPGHDEEQLDRLAEANRAARSENGVAHSLPIELARR